MQLANIVTAAQLRAGSFAPFLSPVTVRWAAAASAPVGAVDDGRGRAANARVEQGKPDVRPGLVPMEFCFRCYRLLPSSRELLRDGVPVECGSRAFDLLHVLLMSRGMVVPRDDIVRHVWPTTFVEESNLRFQVASLRKVLGEDRDLVKTVQGRGYLFAAEFS
jgi:DNA-binding response OmpR family regulator